MLSIENGDYDVTNKAVEMQYFLYVLGYKERRKPFLMSVWSYALPMWTCTNYWFVQENFFVIYAHSRVLRQSYL